MGTQVPLLKKWAKLPTQFLAHVHCGQTAGWIKTALGTEVGLGPCHIVLDGDPAPLPQKWAEPPNYRAISIVAKQLYVSGYHLVRTTEVGHSLGDIVLDGDPASPPLKGAQPPIFGP